MPNRANHQPRLREPVRRLALLLVSPALLLLLACGSNATGPVADDCGSGPFFTALPVALADIDVLAVVGGLGAPGHTLPTAHTGFILSTEGATVRSPGTMRITKLRRTTYLTSPARQGEQDYTADFQVCQQISGWFGHLTTLSASIPAPSGGWKDCQRYSTATETIETCSGSLDNVTLAAGEPLGTSGLSLALGLMGLDFGLLDSRVDNSYVARWRFSDAMLHSTCPWEQFDPTTKAQLYAKLGDKSRPSTVPGGEPQCGTMVVDVSGTAKGVWALPSETQPVAGDETRYITLANYPYRPQVELALSLGSDALGATVALVPRQTSGRVNRAFEQVINDGLIYCYGPDVQRPGSNWLLSLTGPSALSIRKVAATPAVPNMCATDPATWSLAGAVNMVR